MPAPKLRELIERMDSATGETRMGVPSDVRTGLAQLIRSPRVFDVSVAGEELREHITPQMRTLAAMQDWVADVYAGWLLAVVLCASGVELEHDDTLPLGGGEQLTPEGHAWLVQQAMDCVQSDAQRAGILAVLRA